MRSRILFILSIISILCLLSGCGPMYQTTYSFIPPKSHSGKMCLMQCQQNQTLCQQACATRQDACRNDAHQQAFLAYEQYVTMRQSQNKPIKKTANDFYDGSSCNMDCGCTTNYNSCFTACGGSIIPHSKCVAFCGQKNAKPVF